MKGLLTIQEVATQLRVRPDLVYQLAASGSLKTIRVGRLIRVAQDALDLWLAQGGGAGLESRTDKVRARN